MGIAREWVVFEDGEKSAQLALSVCCLCPFAFRAADKYLSAQPLLADVHSELPQIRLLGLLLWVLGFGFVIYGSDKTKQLTRKHREKFSKLGFQWTKKELHKKQSITKKEVNCMLLCCNVLLEKSHQPVAIA